MDSVERFAAAADFERWIVDGAEQGPDAARQAQIQLVRLYAYGLELPEAWSDDLAQGSEVERLTEPGWRKAVAGCERLPLNLYSDVFNPVETKNVTPVTGSLADDLGDIYRDVASGLRAYERGNRAGAVWEWSLGLQSHWGAHATSAIRALHWWLTGNAIDRLSIPRERAG
jgi:Domain of unknown function (DUF5063)